MEENLWISNPKVAHPIDKGQTKEQRPAKETMKHGIKDLLSKALPHQWNNMPNKVLQNFPESQTCSNKQTRCSFLFGSECRSKENDKVWNDEYAFSFGKKIYLESSCARFLLLSFRLTQKQ